MNVAGVVAQRRTKLLMRLNASRAAAVIAAASRALKAESFAQSRHCLFSGSRNACCLDREPDRSRFYGLQSARIPAVRGDCAAPCNGLRARKGAQGLLRRHNGPERRPSLLRCRVTMRSQLCGLHLPNPGGLGLVSRRGRDHGDPQRAQREPTPGTACLGEAIVRSGTYEDRREFHQAVRHRGDAQSSSDSKPQGDARCEKFSATLAKLIPSRAVLHAMNTVDIPVRHPPRDHSQLAVHLRCPTMHVCLVSAAISPLSGCVVLAKNSRRECSFVCSTASSFELLTAVVVDTVGFPKVEPGEHGQVLYEDLTSRRLIFEHLLVLHVVAVGEDTATSPCRMKCFSIRVHFHPTRCHHALHPRLAMDPCHLTLFCHRFLEPVVIVLVLSWKLDHGGVYWAPLCPGFTSTSGILAG
ncbi:hypothetical protein MRX96_030819 [Rhipicephalus microplus]